MAVRSMLATVLFAAGLALGFSSTSVGQGSETGALIETVAGRAIVLDIDTGAVLFEKNANVPFPPASLAKLLTAELAFKALEDGVVREDAAYRVSENAWRTGGAPSRTATMFAELRSDVPVDALLRGVAVQQANDASIILAEGLEGTEAAFVQAMNARAVELGLSQSQFVNATGLPAAGQQTSVRDVATLARYIAATYPVRYGLYAEPEFLWNGIRQRNRNPLLGLGIGATGVATGYDESAGYAIVAIADQNTRRSLVSLAGLESEQVRTREAARLLNWAAETFEPRTLFTAEAPVGRAQVYGGVRSEVLLVTAEDAVALVPTASPDALSGAVIYDGPVFAPVRKGDRIARLEIRLNGTPSIVHDLFAAEDVAEGSFAGRALGAVQELAFGWIRTL